MAGSPAVWVWLAAPLVSVGAVAMASVLPARRANRRAGFPCRPLPLRQTSLSGGWIATNDRVRQLSGGDVARLRRIAMRYHPVKERPANLQIVDVERFADRDVYVARARIDPITTRTLYFDVVTGLLRRAMTTTETMLLPLQDQVDYALSRCERRADAISRANIRRAPYGTITQTFLQIRRNVAIDDAASAR